MRWQLLFYSGESTQTEPGRGEARGEQKHLLVYLSHLLPFSLTLALFLSFFLHWHDLTHSHYTCSLRQVQTETVGLRRGVCVCLCVEWHKMIIQELFLAYWSLHIYSIVTAKVD